ncbi:acyl-CoA dehydrogenase family protein [Saprospira grandis]|uniref:Acyl-CoA dehydrogenase n=1 Tax=Saprospira grandis (strain Lewin) TaxID=984262 RepID=H6KZF5_SAPGL|nr:acyl-CoA dehydrogenase family protein [Saprospira grandis]AFC25731.1 acyl-CoA dehydrogenase [Saprospira grandis str. Lewin]
MAELVDNKQTEVLKGAEYLVRDSQAKETYIPEESNEEQEMIRQMVKDFCETHIYPNYAKIEKQENNIAKDLLAVAGEQGLLSAHIPEEYGGMPMDNNTNTIITEEVGRSGSFSVAVAAHTGIGMLPILYYGTEEQKQKYLPGLCSGQMAASYCLTEPGSGSDALAAKTKAIRSEDGEHFFITGQKMWITNGGFADVFIVFAQVDGDKFTGFLVERGAEGLSLGAEEDKLGIKGSSTRQVFFENVKVSKDAVLGEIGKGHLIAFNVLNVGRFKLGVMTLGAAKRNADLAVQYANERHQFKQPISNFGAIQHKLAQQATQIYAAESALYRSSMLLQQKAKALMEAGKTFAEAKLIAAEEYAVECAMLKVIGSEMLDYVVDETVQIHGGNGFSEEYSAARAYRDARINRIFEGTNEINRLLTFSMTMRRAMKGAIDITGPAWEVQKELASMPKIENLDGPLAQEIKTVKQLKKMALMVAGGAAKYQLDGKLDLKNEQEICMNIADLMIDAFVAESFLLRVQKLAELGKDNSNPEKMLKIFLNDALDRAAKNAKDALCSFADGDALRMMLNGVKRFSKGGQYNVKNLAREVAKTFIDANEYCF